VETVAGEPYTGNEFMATGASDTPDKDVGGEVEHPDLGKLEDVLRDRVEIRSVGMTLLLVLAVFYTLYFARSFFLPVVLAVLLDFLLSPIIRLLKRWRVPEAVGAAIVVAGLLGLVGAGAYSLIEPAQVWIAKAPESLQKIQGRLQKLRRPVEQMSQTAEQVEAATKIGPSGRQEVVIRGPTMSERISGSTQ
jgi:predicted PurR-regulated permease PerM